MSSGVEGVSLGCFSNIILPLTCFRIQFGIWSVRLALFFNWGLGSLFTLARIFARFLLLLYIPLEGILQVKGILYMQIIMWVQRIWRAQRIWPVKLLFYYSWTLHWYSLPVLQAFIFRSHSLTDMWCLLWTFISSA